MFKRLCSFFLVIVLFSFFTAGCNKPAKKPVPQKPQKKTAQNMIPRASAVQYPSSSAPNTAYAGTPFEVKVVQLCNMERQKVGHDLLSEDSLLDKGATTKASDMRDKGYFKHTSPTYGSPFVMMKTFGVSYKTAGENIASGYKTPEAVVKGWMNSPGHRANILSLKYHKIGIGFAKGGKSGAYWVQWFTN